MQDYEDRSADAYAKGALAFASDEDLISSVIEVEYSLATTQSAAQSRNAGHSCTVTCSLGRRLYAADL